MMKEPETAPQRLWNANYVTFLSMQTLFYLMLYLTFPILPKYALSVGIELSDAGLLSGVLFVASVSSRFVTGSCIDRMRRDRILLVSLLVSGLTTMAIALTDKFWVLLMLRFLYGCSFAFFTTTVTSCAADTIPQEHMAEGISYFGVGIAVAAAVGPATSLALYDWIGGIMTFVIAGGISLLCVLCLFFASINERRSATDKSQQGSSFSITRLIEPRAVLFALLVIPITFCNGFVNSFIPLTADERHISGIGVFFTVFAVTMMVLKPLSGKMQDRTGLASVLVPAFICMTASACIISFAQTLWLMIIAALLLAFGQGAGQPALLSSCAMVGGKERRGVALSTYYLGMDVGLGIGNVTGAQVAHALGFTKAYLMCAAMLAIGLIVFLTTKHKHS